MLVERKLSEPMIESSNNSLSLTSSSLAGNASGGASVHAVASSSNPAVPVQAFMPSLKILKRPDSTSFNKSRHSEMTAAEKAAAAKKNLQDRERAYREARKKIFGSDGAAAASANGSASQPGSGTASPSLPSHARMGMTPPGSADASESEGGGSSTSKGKGRRENKAAGSNSSRDSSIPAAAGGTSSIRRRTTTIPADSNATTILREPINPPSSSGKSGNELPRGFNTARRQPPKRVLSPAATEFTPRSINFVALSPDSARQDSQSPLVQQLDQLSLQTSV